MGELCGEAAEAKPSAAQLSSDEKANVIQTPSLKGDGGRGPGSIFVARIFLPTSERIFAVGAWVAPRFFVKLRDDKRGV